MDILLNQLVYFGFLQCVFLLGIYAFSSKARTNINPYLVVLLVVLFIGLLGRTLYALGLFGGTYRLIALSEYATFLFGPTVYLFTRYSLTVKRLSKADLVHYLPAFVYAIVFSSYYMFSSSALIQERLQNGQLYWAVVIFMGAGLLVNGCYWALSVRLYRDFTRSTMDELSFAVKLRFLKSFLVSVGACLLVWLTIYLVGAFGQSWLEREVRPFIWLAIAYIILFISYYNIKEPSIFKVGHLMTPKKYIQSKLSLTELEMLKTKLEKVMTEKKPYLNRNLMKADLAEMLGVNSPDVARLLNEQIGMNFFEYVNYFRIKEFIALASTEKAKTLTFFGLAQEAGFNSKTTFNKSFKKIMGTSPRQYFTEKLG
ncbi:helix-turn-helix domain-containing protein [Roseivirga misakiensis]|uniref:Transcriptional regulator n=1 Tax=Roseivirga misakiensis TaxID=1563681 RepID=A0A1E5T385_9BACT|nr:helix-turn-helix domain-containing protein [Roseivirga misakiensis]OEK05801.1 transcriptional regulator [Roseivirga misakiensis]